MSVNRIYNLKILLRLIKTFCDRVIHGSDQKDKDKYFSRKLWSLERVLAYIHLSDQLIYTLGADFLLITLGESSATMCLSCGEKGGRKIITRVTRMKRLGWWLLGQKAGKQHRSWERRIKREMRTTESHCFQVWSRAVPG